MKITQKHIFPIFLLVALIIAFFVCVEPIKAFFYDKPKIEKELQSKNNQKDSLASILNNIKDNPDYMEKEARNSGYAKKGETMLKIVPEDIQEKNKKNSINAILLLSAFAVIVLIILFALPKRQEKELPENENDDDLE